MTLHLPRVFERRRTRAVRVGTVTIGGKAPVSVQSMTNTTTEDVASTVAQIVRLAEAGCEVVRCGVPTRKAAKAIRQVVQDSPLPVIADVHFDHHLALMAIDAGAHGVRINPGNMRNEDGVRQVYREAAQADVKVRIGVNAGSIRPRRGLEVDDKGQLEDLVGLMVREALNHCAVAEEEGFSNIVLSLKASDVPTTIAAYRAAGPLCDYPFHVGVTEAGPPSVSIVKSAIGIGTLLAEGIGDTIRVSMTGPPEEEIPVCLAILEFLGLREPSGMQIVSCPTCARCEIDVAALVDEVMSKADRETVRGLKIAVMGCVVNGPGEAAEADVGVAGGREFGYLFSHGHVLRKVPANRLAEELLNEIEKFAREHEPRERKVI